MSASEKSEDKKYMKNGEGKLRRKIFVERKSLLVELYESNHTKTFYNFILLTWFVLAVKIVVTDFITTGSVNLTVSIYATAFINFDKAILVWLLIFGFLLLLYPMFVVWARTRTKYLNTPLLKTWDTFCLLFYVTYQSITFFIVVWAFFQFEFYFGCGMMLLCEQTRCLMKGHAFIRTNAPRVMAYDPKRKDSILHPEFNSFVYYLFAPTLIYQDEYPRLKKVRWATVLWFLFEFSLIVTFTGFIAEQFFWNDIRNFGKPDFDKSVLLYIVNGFLPGLATIFAMFYFLLHAWPNAWAEALRFADRRFYEDWWNSTAYGDYYRTWNIIVHDFLYAFIYKETYENILPKNRLAATLSTFYISAIFHEYILGLTLRFFYPVMLVFFGVFGVSLVFIMGKTKSIFGNLFLMFSIFIGNGLMISLYCIEYAARQNCPRVDQSYWDYVIPRSWTCYH